MYLTAIGQPIIVLNSLKAAFELLDRRANIYSDRPRQIIADILCGGRLIALMPYGDEFVCPFFSEIRTYLFLLVGVAFAGPHMKYSQKSQFAIISRFIAKRQFSLLSQCSKTQTPWTSISSAPLHPLPCLYFMTIPHSRIYMTRPS